MKTLASLGLHGLACGLLVAAPACHDSRELRREHAPARGGPKFPGAGTSGSGQYLSSGTVSISCDEPGPLPAGTTGPVSGATDHVECYYDADHPDDPAAVMEWIVESAAEGELIHARLTFNPRFVDNTYGAGAIGWTGAAAPMGPMGPMPKPPKPGKAGHTFKDLVGSDHAEFTFFTGDGQAPLKFKADYLSATADAPSGYASLGVRGGDGKMLTGSADDVIAISTSLERNLNQCGLGDYLLDSPATDDEYTPNPAAPTWDYRVVYDVWVRREPFDEPGLSRVGVDFVHASPSKAGENTIEVTPRKCPPGWTPPGPPPDEVPPPDHDADGGCVPNPDAPCGPETGEPPPDPDAGAPIF